MAQIHPSSIVDPRAELADDVVVGPFCLIGPKVKIGAGTVLKSHVCVEGRTTVGCRNLVYAGASIGCAPQDKKYAGEDTALFVGDDNVIRENCTLSIGTVQDHGETHVGSRNLLMANVHIAHDCIVGDDTIIANNVAFAGHVHVGDWAIVGGQVGVHQFTRIGAHAMVGGASAVHQDVAPYTVASGNPAKSFGLNIVGLRRRGFTPAQVKALHRAYQIVFRDGDLLKDALAKVRALKNEFADAGAMIDLFADFLENSPRGFVR